MKTPKPLRDVLTDFYKLQHIHLTNEAFRVGKIEWTEHGQEGTEGKIAETAFLPTSMLPAVLTYFLYCITCKWQGKFRAVFNPNDIPSVSRGRIGVMAWRIAVDMFRNYYRDHIDPNELRFLHQTGAFIPNQLQEKYKAWLRISKE